MKTMFNNTPVWAADDGTGGGEPAEGGDLSLLEAGGTPAADGGTPPAEGEPKAPPAAGEGDPAAPVSFDDLTLPEGMDATTDDAVAFLALMNDGDKTTAERTQALLDMQTTSMNTAVEGMKKELQTYWDENRTTNQKAVRELEGFEGPLLNENLAQIKKGLEAVGATEATFKAFTETGAGDHPEIVRVLFELTKIQREGGPVFGTPAKGKLSQADRMFG